MIMISSLRAKARASGLKLRGAKAMMVTGTRGRGIKEAVPGAAGVQAGM
jgi:hypothetical protein